jgi:hypothetical protein
MDSFDPVIDDRPTARNATLVVNSPSIFESSGNASLIYLK